VRGCGAAPLLLLLLLAQRAADGCCAWPVVDPGPTAGAVCRQVTGNAAARRRGRAACGRPRRWAAAACGGHAPAAQARHRCGGHFCGPVCVCACGLARPVIGERARLVSISKGSPSAGPRFLGLQNLPQYSSPLPSSYFKAAPPAAPRSPPPPATRQTLGLHSPRRTDGRRARSCGLSRPGLGTRASGT